MLTWQLPVKRSPISIYKISNGQFSFWVKTFANTDCLQKKVPPIFLLFWEVAFKLTSCSPSLLWCFGGDAENWEFANLERGLRPIFALHSYFGLRSTSHVDIVPSIFRQQAVDSRSRARESRPTAEILKRKKSAQLWWSVRTTLCETALRHRTLFNPPRTNCTAPKDSPWSWDQIDRTFDHYHLTSRPSQVDQVGWFEAAMFCSAPLCCHVVSPTHTTLLLSVWKPQGWAWTLLGTEMHKNADGFRGNYLLCNYMDL